MNRREDERTHNSAIFSRLLLRRTDLLPRPRLRLQIVVVAAVVVAFPGAAAAAPPSSSGF